MQSSILSFLLRCALVAIYCSAGFSSCSTTTAWENSKYFATSFLQNTALVRTSLINEEGFQEVHFFTQDGIQLTGLLLMRPCARYTLISCAGFYPGKKEGMATLFHLLPEECNMLFFDARGHGQSAGPFKRTIAHYGVHEYKDIIAAVHYMHMLAPELNIIIHSICAGSLHAIHALHVLESNNHKDAHHIKGLIVDSCFASLSATMDTVYHHTRLKVLPACLTATLYCNDTKETVQQRYLYKTLWALTYSFLKVVDIIVRPTVEHHEPETNLFTIINTIKTPIFYIHAIDDTYASIQDAQELALNTLNKECWWVERSDHTLNHLKHKHIYREKIIAFIEKVLHLN